MRAVKSVLVMAGQLRRSEKGLDEEMILIRAMRDSNIPKFLEQDVPLFRNIIMDLFPDVAITNVNYGKLQDAVEAQLEVKNYIKKDSFLNKIVQLMETVRVRHGVMLVGVTGTGKTTVIHTLARAMT
jgi:dynein heavy chain